MKKGKWFLKCLIGGIFFLLLLGLTTMLLWNWLIPSLFNGPEIRFLEALGLIVLSKILFSGWGGGRRCGPRGGPSWKNRYYEKLSSMSPEDRERFKTRLREKWCSPGGAEPKEKMGNSNV
jgi:hypothetical protein